MKVILISRRMASDVEQVVAVQMADIGFEKRQARSFVWMDSALVNQRRKELG